MARISDVATRAGVSPATVSRVLNGKRVRTDLADAVGRAVAELGYVPDATARSLRRGHSDVIALVVPDIENPFFTTVARAVEDVAQDAGYSVVLCNTDDDPAKESRYLDIALRENMAGVIIAPASSQPDLAALTARGRAAVIIDRETGLDVEHITFDNLAIGREGTRQLIERGHVKIACITGPRATSTAVQRAQGWQAELAEAGHPPDPRWLAHANFRVDGGRDATAAFLRSGLFAGDGPTAILATNNLVGVGVLQELAGRKLGPGEPLIDVGIIGDLPFATSDLSGVSVTGLAPGDLGARAARALLAQLPGGSRE